MNKKAMEEKINELENFIDAKFEEIAEDRRSIMKDVRAMRWVAYIDEEGNLTNFPIEEIVEGLMKFLDVYPFPIPKAIELVEHTYVMANKGE
jgi:hypothetical protein